MKEKEFGNIYSLGEDLDERFAWCVQLIDNELCIAIHCTTQSGHSPFNNKSFYCSNTNKKDLLSACSTCLNL